VRQLAGRKCAVWATESGADKARRAQDQVDEENWFVFNRLPRKLLYDGWRPIDAAKGTHPFLFVAPEIAGDKV
jgi:hypothetical protein